VAPENRSTVVKQLRSLFFTEEKYDEFEYIKKAKEIFDKFKGINLRIT